MIIFLETTNVEFEDCWLETQPQGTLVVYNNMDERVGLFHKYLGFKLD